MGVGTGKMTRGLVAPRHVLGVALMAAGLLLVGLAAGTAAATPAPTSQCPDGYHWERMSGVGCVQTKLPPHAKYSYESNAICQDGYVGVHAAGPNAYGKDPKSNYLVACLTPEQAAASAGADATPATYDGGGNDADDMTWLGKGPLDELAAALAEDGKNTVPPTPSDADLGGVAATGLLLLTAGGATIASGGAGAMSGLLGGGAGGPAGSGGSGGSGGGTAAPDAEKSKLAAKAAAKAAKAAAAAATAQPFPNVPPVPQVGGVTTAATSGLPLPKPELIAAGLSIFRSMKRVTSEADPSGYSPGDIAQLVGDATTIGALASIIAPAANVISVVAGGASTAADTTDPKELLDRLRRSFGQLGYMQGILDQNIDRVDGKLAGLDGAPEGEAAKPAPEVPADVSTLTYKQLREARATWASRADVAFDALIAAQADLADLDDRRRNLGHQIDAVNDLLANLDNAGTIPVPPHLADTLRYGLGWYKVADPDRMVAALREARLMGYSGAGSTAQAAPSAAAESTAPGKSAGKGKDKAAPPPKPSKPPKGTPFAHWAVENGFIGGRISVLEALAGLERWCGFYDALTGTIQGQIAILRAQADTAAATRRTLSAEIQHRSLEGAE